jgi:hypothetical protein
MLVLISGGGIADLTLAYWLQQYTIPSVVIEQATTLRRDGYAIDFLGHRLRGRGFAKFFVPGSPLGLAVQRTMMGVLLRPAFRGLLRRQFEAESVLSLQDAKPTQQAVQQEGLPYS